MMLPFSGQLDKILDGSKTMTTRLDAKDHYKDAWYRHEEDPLDLDMWFGNRFDPSRYKMGITKWSDTTIKRGFFFTRADAKRDGFELLWDYRVTLANHHDMTVDDVNQWVWTQMGWKKDGWLDGPHPRKVA